MKAKTNKTGWVVNAAELSDTAQLPGARPRAASAGSSVSENGGLTAPGTGLGETKIFILQNQS